ncbi:MAG: hypothetical protein KCHDKBKB_01631 [Elusimicrobia bacterium]|nr:hypothetical protein [Elusimicrobiota bacterium]
MSGISWRWGWVLTYVSVFSAITVARRIRLLFLTPSYKIDLIRIDAEQTPQPIVPPCNVPGLQAPRHYSADSVLVDEKRAPQAVDTDHRHHLVIRKEGS